jgi:nucleoside-diphosphate-sugar epimerase
MKKVLLIGGTGLISTAIANLLLRNGCDVTLFNRGERPGRHVSSIRVVKGDRNEFSAFEIQMMRLPQYDCVIDMICYAPDQAESMIRAFKGRIGQLIFCSTVDVYNKPALKYPIREDAAKGGNNSYGRNKAACEEIFQRSHDRRDFAVTVIRPAWTYGEGGGLISYYGWGTLHLDRIRKQKPLIVQGDGSALLAACHVEDLAAPFVQAVGREACFGKAYHVAGEEWLTWNEYYRLTAEALQAPAPELVHIPTDLLGRIAPNQMNLVLTNFQHHNIFDNCAARADLDFRYRTSFAEGVRRTIEWLDWNGKIDNSDLEQTDDRIIEAWNKLGGRMSQDLADLGSQLQTVLREGYSTISGGKA